MHGCMDCCRIDGERNQLRRVTLVTLVTLHHAYLHVTSYNNILIPVAFFFYCHAFVPLLQVIDEKMVEHRMAEQRRLRPKDGEFYIMELGQSLFVDAKEKGNLMRLINHRYAVPYNNICVLRAYMLEDIVWYRFCNLRTWLVDHTYNYCSYTRSILQHHEAHQPQVRRGTTGARENNRSDRVA